LTRENFIKLLKNKNWGVDEGVGITLKNGSKTFIANKLIDDPETDVERLIKEIGSLDVEHRSRVVGYMSDVKNWNKSKVGELKDRQKGSYGYEKPKEN